MSNVDSISFVSEEIAYFLSREKQACIPGFGRFVSERQQATLNKAGSELLAPFNKISFISNLEESNTDFSDFIDSYHPDNTLLDDFVNSFVSKLLDQNRVELPELGVCSLNEQGVFQFVGIPISDITESFQALKLNIKTVSQPVVITEPEELNTPGEASASIEFNDSSRSRAKLIRIGMVLSCFVMLIAFMSQYKWEKPATTEYQKVPTNYNISPQDQEIIVASEDGILSVSEIGDAQEIIERQKLMSAEIVETEVLNKATIITNTFGNQRNVEKQLRLISNLGYQGSTLHKDNGLVSTLIALEYKDEQDLDHRITLLKKDFPRAKRKK